jgi:hypothetical protein
MRQRLYQLLPALLLVLGQKTALLVHQADIDAHAHGETCNVCLLAHGVDNAVPAGPTILPCIRASLVPAAEPQSGSQQRTRNIYLARAPPAAIHPIV